jgi:hypothetical protein
MDVKAATLKRSPSTAMFPDVTVNCAVPLVPMTLLRLVSIRSSASVFVLAGQRDRRDSDQASVCVPSCDRPGSGNRAGVDDRHAGDQWACVIEGERVGGRIRW